jgi:hypothetical protein
LNPVTRPAVDTSGQSAVPLPTTPPLAESRPTTATGQRRKFDRSIVEGPLLPVVWKLALAHVLTNIIGGVRESSIM